jgi:methionyl-tRNA synthetase
VPKVGGRTAFTTNSDYAATNIQNRIAVLRRTHLYTHESLRIASILLQPFMPSKTAEVLDILGVDDDHRNWSDATLGRELRIEQESERYNSEWGVLFSPLESWKESSGNVESPGSKQANQTIDEKKSAS